LWVKFSQHLGDKLGSRRLRQREQKFQINFAFHPEKAGKTNLYGDMQILFAILGICCKRRLPVKPQWGVSGYARS
jgi:hypothetical protein